jgi:glycosyltransferase involved in cell wall biosynthesis
VGHLVDRCGSARPHRIAHNFSRLQREIDLAAQVPILTVSEFVRARMIDAGAPAEQLTTLLSPAPPVSAPAPPLDPAATPRFLFLGRLIPEKGILWLLRAFERACETPSFDAHLDVAGTGEQADEARRFVQTQGLADRVTFHGWVSPENVPALMQTAWAVVLPSLWHEPAGLVSLEAAAHGRALIASRVGGIPEYATDDYALPVRPNNIPDLADALTTLAAHPDRTAALGSRGRTVAVDRFSMSGFLTGLDARYTSIQTAGAPVTDSEKPDASL